MNIIINEPREAFFSNFITFCFQDISVFTKAWMLMEKQPFNIRL